MSIIIILIVVAVIVFAVVKKKNANPGTISTSNTAGRVSSEVLEGDVEDFSANPILADGLSKLKSAVAPNKHGEYNDAKKIGKTIATINEQVSTILKPGSEEYVKYFHSLYRAVIGSMVSSSDSKMKKAIEYTLNQQAEWEQTGKCQTFVKGLSEDSLVAEAEVIMTACEKCWFDQIKTTMWRKDMEKFNLPKSV